VGTTGRQATNAQVTPSAIRDEAAIESYDGVGRKTTRIATLQMSARSDGPRRRVKMATRITATSDGMTTLQT
jgi:hypothetical protein